MSFYDEYKPLRDYMQRFDLLTGLIDVWCYSLHIIENQPLPAGYAVGLDSTKMGSLKDHVHPWDLDVLAKEIVLNSGSDKH